MRFVGVVAIVVIGLLSIAATAAGNNTPKSRFTDKQLRKIKRLSPQASLPADPTNRFADNKKAARFGQRLFFDKRLSGNGEISCATCHDPHLSFHDGKTLAEGVGPLTRHTMSLLNVGSERWFFWDGRSDTLWAQTLDPIEVAAEMAGSRTRVARVVRDDPTLRREYESIFGALPSELTRDLPEDARPVGDAKHAHEEAWSALDDKTRKHVNQLFVNAGKSIAAYLRQIRTGPSPFDRYVETLFGKTATKGGAPPALSPSAERGLELFVGKANCRFCHGGPRLSDGEFHDTGVAPLREKMPVDSGRYRGIEVLRASPFNAAGKFSDDPDGAAATRTRRVTQTPQNFGRFKTPSLRNVARTAPYMHQGQLPTLEAVVRFYSTREGARPPGHHDEQILAPLNLTETEIADLVAFLESLTGTPPDAELLAPPKP